jgi:tetratricopeptide (TPR) repeat protein
MNKIIGVSSRYPYKINVIFTKERIDHYQFGDMFYQQGNLDMAIQEYKKGLETDIKNTFARGKLGFLFYKKGMKDEAIKEFKSILEIDPNDIQARQSLAIAQEGR